MTISGSVPRQSRLETPTVCEAYPGEISYVSENIEMIEAVGSAVTAVANITISSEKPSNLQIMNTMDGMTISLQSENKYIFHEQNSCLGVLVASNAPVINTDMGKQRAASLANSIKKASSITVPIKGLFNAGFLSR